MVISTTKIPMSSPDITDLERDAVAKVLRTPILSMGDELIKFENSIRAFTGSKHAIGVSSGTAGLHLCVIAAGITAGDFVITTPFSFVASTNVFLYEGAIPLFVDVDIKTGNIDPEKIADVIHRFQSGNHPLNEFHLRNNIPKPKQIKAIVPVDVFGQPADLDPILSIARDFDLKVIEDSCEALGAEYKHQPAGTIGDYGVFAFYPNKQITTGEGAVIVTSDDDAAATMKSLRNQGRSPGDTWLNHSKLGYNYRLDEMSAALGRVQMDRLNELIGKRSKVANYYNERVDDIPEVESQHVAAGTTRMSWFVYVVRFAAGEIRDHVAKELNSVGIDCRPYFTPIHLQPYMIERFGFKPGDFPITEELGRRGLALPFSGVMTEDQVDRVCSAVKKSVKDLSG